MPVNTRITGGAFLLIALIGASTPLNSATHPKEALISSEFANAYIKPSADSEVAYHYQRLSLVRLTDKAAFQTPGGEFFLVEGTKGKKSSKNHDSIPDLWVKRSDLILFDDFKAWSGYWPIKSLDFVDGIIEYHITFTKDGLASGNSPEGGAFSARVYFLNNIVVIRTDHDNGSFYFNFDFSKHSLSSPIYDSITQKTRGCD